MLANGLNIYAPNISKPFVSKHIELKKKSENLDSFTEYGLNISTKSKPYLKKGCRWICS